MGSHLFKGNPKVGEARKQPLRFLRQSPGKSQFSPKVAAEFSPSPPALSGLSAEGSALVSASSSAFSAGLFHLPAGARTGKSPVVSAATEQHPSLAAGVSSSSSVGLHDGKTFRMLYLFSGTKRKADVGWFLRVLCKLHKVTLLLQEFDLCNGEDLSMEEDWAKVLGLIESKGFDLVFSTPPSNGDFRGFDPALRVRVNIATQPWVVLNSMLKQGRALYSVIREGRIESSKRKLEKFAGPFVRSQKKSFRERDPWQ
ncbi:unnamed protein product [Polarella glacialis]|uniref:Uncharacterized protein n=1 Tax=Polarella glacialis TaxID=89957 RepID=A0A813FE97_POLGL|nr:unnamed protein product [Polarella glacialis]